MNTTSLYDIKWTTIINDYAGVSGYTGQKRWREIFIYGLALHLATDAFAHSSYYMASDGKIKKFHHKNKKEYDDYDENHLSDETNHVKNRWKCARYIAEYIAINCTYRVEGEVPDFSAYGESCWKGFYMWGIYRYAKGANNGEFELQDIKDWFLSMEYYLYEAYEPR